MNESTENTEPGCKSYKPPTRIAASCSKPLNTQGPALLHAVPEAHLVQLHRDPVKVFASFASLNLTTQGLATNIINVQQNAAANLRFLEEEVKRNLRDREMHPGAVYDVSYNDVVADPLGTVRAIYHHYELDITDTYHESLERYIKQNPQGKYGTHRYAASDFDFSDGEVRRRFNAYYEGFGFAT